MKMVIIGLEGADPEILLGEETLVNLRRLMEYGSYGRLTGEENISVHAAWLSLLSSLPAGQFMASGVDLPQLGSLQDSSPAGQWVWSPIRSRGKLAHILVESEGAQMLDSVYTASPVIFSQARELMQGAEWEFLLLIDRGLVPLHQAELAGFLAQESARAYYNHLDAQVGAVLELVDDETLVLVLSLCSSSSHKGTSGSFILASSNNPLSGEITDVSLLEIAPTILELSGNEIPESMQGKSIIAGKAVQRLSWGNLSAEEEEILRERLSGLGYIS